MSFKEHSESPSESRTSPPLSIFPLSGGGLLYVGKEKPNNKKCKRAGKNIGNLGPNQAQNSMTLSTMSWKDNNYNIKLSFYCQTQKTVNTWKISGMLIVYWPITIKFRTREQTSKPQTNYRCCLRFSCLAPYWLISRNTITFHKYIWCSRFCEFHSEHKSILALTDSNRRCQHSHSFYKPLSKYLNRWNVML